MAQSIVFRSKYCRKHAPSHVHPALSGAMQACRFETVTFLNYRVSAIFGVGLSEGEIEGGNDSRGPVCKDISIWVLEIHLRRSDPREGRPWGWVPAEESRRPEAMESLRRPSMESNWGIERQSWPLALKPTEAGVVASVTLQLRLSPRLPSWNRSSSVLPRLVGAEKVTFPLAILMGLL